MIEYSSAVFLYVALIKIFDLLTVLGAWFFAWHLRFQTSWLPIHKGIPDFALYQDAILPMLLSFCTAFHLIGAYRKDRVFFGFRAIKKVVQGAIVGALVFVSLLYFMEATYISRVYIGLFTFLCALFLLAERFVVQLFWKWIERKVIKQIRVLLIGSGDLLEMYVQKIQRRQPYPIHWVGRLGLRAERELPEVNYLGGEELLERTISQRRPDLAVVSYAAEDSARYASVLETLSNELVAVKVVPDFGRYSTFTYSAGEECGIPLLYFNHPPMGVTDRFLKRIVDILGALFFMTVFAPFYLLISLLVKLTSRGPVFFSQVRIGADGQIFKMYKFRSMREDAEAQTGAVWAVKEDPRVTKIGKFLRKTSLDEIPQFFNVLKGEMSLVGPRPERPIFVDQFKKEIPKYMQRHKIKSGITGWAQINGWRGNTSIDERIKHDLFYIENWSHYFDIKILVLTLTKGFINRHAY